MHCWLSDAAEVLTFTTPSEPTATSLVSSNFLFFVLLGGLQVQEEQVLVSMASLPGDSCTCWEKAKRWQKGGKKVASTECGDNVQLSRNE
jgi:hypothetical protein